jgi:hypothetical protein
VAVNFLGIAVHPSVRRKWAEAVRRVLPELRKLDRYERRAAARRDRAVLDLLVEQIEQQLLVAKREMGGMDF